MVDIAYVLRLERDHHYSDGLYDWSQIQFSYNNNHMEGSTITLGQTAQIYSTGNYIAEKDQLVREDDQKESSNHFKVFNYMLDTVNQPLTLEYVAKLQGILKANTSDVDNPLKVVGGFKKYNNSIERLVTGDVVTANASDVPDALRQLFREWEHTTNRDLAAYAKFHYRFEKIHPFSDGNGRVGRVLLFKERCRNHQMPFIIRNENRPFYIRGLQEFANQPGYLIDTLGQSLDEYESAVKQVYGERLEKLPQPPKKRAATNIRSNFPKRKQPKLRR